MIDRLQGAGEGRENVVSPPIESMLPRGRALTDVCLSVHAWVNRPSETQQAAIVGLEWVIGRTFAHALSDALLRVPDEVRLAKIIREALSEDSSPIAQGIEQYKDIVEQARATGQVITFPDLLMVPTALIQRVIENSIRLSRRQVTAGMAVLGAGAAGISAQFLDERTVPFKRTEAVNAVKNAISLSLFGLSSVSLAYFFGIFYLRTQYLKTTRELLREKGFEGAIDLAGEHEQKILQIQKLLSTLDPTIFEIIQVFRDKVAAYKHLAYCEKMLGRLPSTQEVIQSALVIGLGHAGIVRELKREIALEDRAAEICAEAKRHGLYHDIRKIISLMAWAFPASDTSFTIETWHDVVLQKEFAK